MPYRFTSTEKWKDAWFTNLSQLEMLLFLYLCDNCDIAGFIDINLRQWAFDLHTNEIGIKGALKGLEKGLVFSECGETIYIRNFLKHQKNYPLNENNMAHRGIIKCFKDKGYKFDIQNINEFIEGACKGLYSSYGIGIGIGIGNNIDKGKDKKEETEKEKNIPTYEEFKKYALRNKPNLNTEKLKLKYEAWKVNNWKDGHDKPIKNWKSKLLNTISYIEIVQPEGKQYKDVDKDNELIEKLNL